MGTKLGFAGYVVTPDGIMPDEGKLNAIKDFPAPKDVTGVRSFLGMVNQLGHYIPDLAQRTDPLRQLLKKDIQFQWLKEQQEAFDSIKDRMTFLRSQPRHAFINRCCLKVRAWVCTSSIWLGWQCTRNPSRITISFSSGTYLCPN